MKPIRKIPIVLIVLAALIVTARAADQGAEAKRHSLNKQRIAKLNSYMRPKVGAVLSDLERKGYRPLIDTAVWRSPAQQAELVNAGRSQVYFSFHNCSTPSGAPDSLAADITDQRWAWDSPTPFWLQLAASAESHKCVTGIYWGLSPGDRERIHRTIARRNWSADVATGWDTAHVQPTNFSLDDARRGMRPH